MIEFPQRADGSRAISCRLIVMAKMLSALLLAVGAICLLLAAIMATTVRALDISILDVYFVISPKYLLIAGLVFCLATLMIRKIVAQE